ncbi:MAG: DUF3857 domain-containing protein [Phycisphaerales bacterium]|nr:DUF3857 domain-containing protein [Phycisphaerales bacterium]
MNTRQNDAVRSSASETLRRARDHGWTRLLASIALLLIAPACHAANPPVSAAPDAPADGLVDLSAGVEQFPDADAVILRLEQHWTIKRDGTVHRREHRWVKLLDRRAIGRYADPRINFSDGTDKVIIHSARTYLPDGTILPVPDYSYNIASPNDLSGWPAYIEWQQRIISFSGIENGCVLEFDYEVITQPGVMPWVSADLRLHLDDPTVQRIVSFQVEGGVLLHAQVTGMPGPYEPEGFVSSSGWRAPRWTFDMLAADTDEPQAPPWQERGGRFMFTTCPSAEAWVGTVLGAVENAAAPTERIEALARDAVGDEQDLRLRIEAVSKKLRDTFNFVTSPKSMRSFRCRPAGDVLVDNYGNPLESAALLLAAYRSLGIEAEPMAAVDTRTWREDVPTDSAFVDVVIAIETDDGPMYVRPQHGTFTNPGDWGSHTLLTLDQDGGLQRMNIVGRGDEQESTVEITGVLHLEADGAAEADLRVSLTGAFYDPEALDTTDAQQARSKAIVNRLLPGFDVDKHALTTLSDDAFAATISVRSDDLDEVGAQHMLKLGDGPVFLTEFPLPLDRPHRRTDVELAGRFAEHIDLTIVLPEGAVATIVPASLPEVTGSWGSIAQTVMRDGSTIHIVRDINVIDRISATDYPVVREAINALRAPGSLYLAYTH